MNSDRKQEFVTLIEQHQHIINNLCKVYYKNIEDQQDARQDVILQLWKSFPNFRGEAKVSTWIYRVSLNTILAKIRNQKHRIAAIALDEKISLQVSTVFGMDDDIQQLKVMIAGLKEQDKAVIVLYLEGYKNKEIAEILDITPSNVSTRLNRIKNTLKSNYKKYTDANS
ncbi:MAG: sigma-70 family RNA polymerase sigma factor [Bacteroidota bacterium]